MRKIGSLKEKIPTQRFLLYLLKRDIKATCETHGESFDIWVYEEEDVAQAESIFQEFCKNPESSQFLSSLEAQEGSSSLSPLQEGLSLDFNKKGGKTAFVAFPKRPKSSYRVASATMDITKGIIGICLFFYLVLGWGIGDLGQKKIQAQVLYWTKYEVPEIFLQREVISSIKRPWVGYLPLWIQQAHGKDIPISARGGRFLQIKKGEVWRLVTPCLLHIGFLHFLFNMLWLWMLGFQIERVLGASRYIFLLILMGAFSNTVQYLINGPDFLGFSGVICGMIGFIWMRQKKSPGEGYVLDRGTLNFVLVFVLGMAALELFSIGGALLQVSTVHTSVANSAHLAGGIIGLFLGRSTAFSVKE